jgi:hypothetical protein
MIEWISLEQVILVCMLIHVSHDLMAKVNLIRNEITRIFSFSSMLEAIETFVMGCNSPFATPRAISTSRSLQSECIKCRTYAPM